MSRPWQEMILDELERLDEREAPHGLYGLRAAHATPGDVLPGYAVILQSPKFTDAVRRSGLAPLRLWDQAEILHFEAPAGEQVVVEIRAWASTKVRRFGSRYQLDPRVDKGAEENCKIEDRLPKLARPRVETAAPADAQRGTAILLLAHAPALGEIERWLGRAVNPEFLDRYQIEVRRREWVDRFGREFFTGLYLWSGRG